METHVTGAVEGAKALCLLLDKLTCYLTIETLPLSMSMSREAARCLTAFRRCLALPTPDRIQYVIKHRQATWRLG